MEKLYTPEEVSKLLAISIQTLANWRCQGIGPAFVKVGSRVRYSEAALNEYLEKPVDKNQLTAEDN